MTGIVRDGFICRTRQPDQVPMMDGWCSAYRLWANLNAGPATAVTARIAVAILVVVVQKPESFLPSLPSGILLPP